MSVLKHHTHTHTHIHTHYGKMCICTVSTQHAKCFRSLLNESPVLGMKLVVMAILCLILGGYVLLFKLQCKFALKSLFLHGEFRTVYYMHKTQKHTIPHFCILYTEAPFMALAVAVRT